MKPLSGFGNTVVISHYYCDQLHIFYDVNKNANHISLLPLQMAWFVVKTKMKRRWLFALPGHPQDFKNLQLVKVNKLDFVCQQNSKLLLIN